MPGEGVILEEQEVAWTKAEGGIRRGPSSFLGNNLEKKTPL